jgi:site-specific DNA recombinase
MSDTSSTVILARVSSKSQEDEGYSLDSQLKLLQSYCDTRDLSVVKVFRIAEAASKEQSRKVFHEMLSYVSQNSVFNLAVEKTDRLTRNFRDAVAIDDWLEKDANRRLHAVKENLLLHKDAKSDTKFMWNIHVSVAKRITDNLREEAMKGWAEKLAQGWLPASPPPGYKTITDNGKRIHIPNRETDKLMLEAFKHYRDPGESLDSCVLFMEKLGIVTRAGRRYSKSHLQRILTNPFYIGINRFNGQEYPGAQEAIIPERLFQQVQQKMHNGRPRSYNKHHSPLQGLIRCQDCGSIVTWQLQKGQYYGICRRLTDNCKQAKMLREDKIEEMIMLELQRLVYPSPEVTKWVADTMRTRHKVRIEQRERMQSSLKARINRISNMDETLYDDKLSGEITKERYEVKHEQFVTQQAELQEQHDKIDLTLGERLEQRLVILELSQKAASIYAKKPPEQKRLIISKLFAQLSLQSGSLSVKYSKFTQAIADRVQKTRNLMEDTK